MQIITTLYVKLLPFAVSQSNVRQLIRYLQHYCNLPSWKAYDGRMTDVDLNGMTFACGRMTYRIPFNPAMGSYREARERAVAMDKESLEGLSKSDITVKECVWPHGLYTLDFLIVAATFVAYSQRWWFGRGEVVEQYLGSSFAKFCWIIQPYMITGLFLIHGTEAIVMASKHLRKHSVNVRTAIWWQWVFFGFVEGVFAFRRFNGLVERKRAEKEKQKH